MNKGPNTDRPGKSSFNDISLSTAPFLFNLKKDLGSGLELKEG